MLSSRLLESCVTFAALVFSSFVEVASASILLCISYCDYGMSSAYRSLLRHMRQHKIKNINLRMAYNVAIQCHKIRKAYIADVEKVF